MLPLLIPTAPGEAGEVQEFLIAQGIPRVRELSLAEAVEMLRGDRRPYPETGKILKKVRLVAWRSGDQLRPALYLEDRMLAPYVRYFMRTEGERGIGRCPKCGDWFVQARPDQIYCSIVHRERHRVTRWRAGAGSGKTELFLDSVVNR